MVDEDDERQIGRYPAWLDRRRLLLTLGVALDIDDPRGEELAGNLDGFADVTTRIPAQIEDEPIRAGRASGIERFDEGVPRSGGELLEADVGDVRVRDHGPRDWLDVDVRTDDPEDALGSVGACPHGQDDRRAGFATHPADDRVEVGANGRSAVDVHEDVAGVEPGALGGAAVEDTDDERQAVLRHVHLGTDPDIRAVQ